MKIDISNEARQVLEAAGWHEGYGGNVDQQLAFLSGRGFQVPPVAAEFLHHFHGLKFRVPNRGGLSFVEFDVHGEMSWIEPEDQPFLTALLNKPLCPIGFGGGELIFLTADGEMVLVSDQWFGYSRLENIREGMDVILGIRRPPGYSGVPLAKNQIPPGFG